MTYDEFRDNSPDDKFMSTIKVGLKGQIVIPKEVREMFNINPGDTVVLLADKNRGIAIQQSGVLEKIISSLNSHPTAGGFTNE